MWRLAAFAYLVATSASALGADFTWTGATDALWSVTTNWNAIGTPGAADRAIFDGTGNANTTIDLGAGQSTLGILFTSSSAAAYTIGSGGVNAQTFTLAASGTIAVDSTVVTNQLFHAAVLLGDATSGTYTFQNEDLGNLLTFSGSVAGGAVGTAGAKTLVVAGAGNTTISGAITNGGATSLGLTKSDTGTLILSGSNTFKGAFAIAGGQASISGNTNISTGAAGTTSVGTAAAVGRLDVSGAFTTWDMYLGTTSGATGVVNQSGGVVTVNRAASVSNLQIGAAGGAFGYYGLTSGTLTANELGVGGAGGGNGTGILDVSGGTVDIAGWITLNRAGNAGQNSVLNVSGSGSVIARGGNGLQHNWGGTTVVNLSGSALLRHAVNAVSAFSSGTGIVNLNGGTFEVQGGLAGGGALSLLNFNGGTLKSLATNTLVADSFSAAYVYGGGAIIDTNGFTSTVNEPLLAASGSGVSSIAVTGGGSGYVAPPLVSITGGGGTGATGFATITNGTVSGITITNPGTGYTSAPTVTLSGGGGTGATIGTVTTAANTSGGLTKNGAGTLILNNASTYTGTTTVNAGTLQLGAVTAAGSIGSTTGIVNLGTVVLYDTANSAPSTWAFPVSGTGSLTRYGVGTLTLSGSNTFTGPITLSGGVLAGDATTAATPLGNGSAVTTTGFTTLRLTGAAATSRTQVLGGLTVSSGALTVDISNPGTSTTLDLSGTAGTSTIARSGNATVNFTAGAGTFGTDAIVKTAVSQSLVNGILGPWATVGGANWATVSSGSVVAYSGYTDINAQGSTLADGATTNVRIAAAGSGAAVALGATTTSVNTLLQGTTTAATLDTAGKTLRAAGIMVGSGQAALTIGSAVGNGTLTAATAGGELILNNSSTNTLTVNAVVANNTSASVLTKTGPGTVVLAGVNTYTGNTVVNDGLLTIAGSRTGQGTLTVQGGTLRVSGTVTSGVPSVGAAAGSRGVLDVTGGLTTTTLDVGGAIGAAGVVRQSGNLTTTAGDSRIGNVAGSYGAWLVSGGTASVAQTQIGASGNGVFVQTAGSVSAAAWPVIGRFAGGIGHATISGGTFTQTGGANRLIIGENGVGVLTISGSAAVENVGGTLISQAGGVGTVNLRGGTLTTPFIQDNTPGSSLLNLNGGTIRARAANTNFFTAIDTVVVHTGGATIDTNGFDLTIGSTLLVPAGSGVSSIPVSAGGSGYLAPPLVLLSGGGGSGATAIATVDASGAITGITITNPGTSYTSAPTVTLVGGGGSGATIGTVTTAANVGGGITKTGSGTLTFTAVNTYSGTTTVNQGTLISNASLSVRGPVTVNQGATFQPGANDVIQDAFPVTLVGGTYAMGTFADYIGNLTLGSGAAVTGSGTTNSLITNGVVNSKIATTGTGLAGTIAVQLALASQFGPVTGNRTQEFEVGANATLLVTGSIVNTQPGSTAQVGGLRKTGLGTLTLSAVNTYTGVTTVSAGRLNVASTGAIAAGNTLTVADGASAAELVIDGTVNRTQTNIGTSSGVGSVVVNAGGSLNVTGEIWVGTDQTNLSYGALTIAGGTVTTTSWLALGRGVAAGSSTSRGLLTMSSGALNVTGGNLAIGAFQLSRDAMSVMAISGGAVTVTNNVYAGEGLSGILDVSGGTLTTGSTAGITVKAVSTGTGIVNLRGGTVTTGYLVGGAGGTDYLNFNGGLLRASQNATAGNGYIGALTSAYVYGGGALLDTGTFSIVVTQPLLAPTGDGLATIAVTGGTGYTVAPIVDISGGGGVGATALASIDSSGNLIGITVTNPGVGYTSSPTVTLVGGGGSGAVIGTIALAPNASGGLTKSGSGSLTLSGANTFTGTTRLADGGLTIANATALGGSTLDLNALDSGTITAINQNSTLGGLAGSRNLDMLTRTLTIGANNQSTTYSGALSNGALTKTGTGTLTLSGANTYGGDTTVIAGALRLEGSGSNAGTLGIGTVSGSTGRLELTGTMTVGNLYAGRTSGANGVLVQSPGSSLTVTAGSEHRVGEVAGGYGAYLMNGGTTFVTNALQIGGYGNGVLVQTAGHISAGTFWPILGRHAGSVGHATISGGTYSQSNASTRFIIGENGTGVLTLTNAGAVETVGGVRVSMAGGVGTVNLDGGIMLTPFVEDGGGTSLFSFDGGTLRARSASTTFLQGLDSAVVNAGGAGIDTNGFAVTIAQPLLAASGSGVASIAVAAGGSGYAAPPLVTFAGGGGSGATAVATVDASGAVTGITVTNPGTGYTSAPTVTLVGGGGTNAALGTVTLAANVSGGLLKTGSGTLTLSGSNTFSGTTRIVAGGLSITNANALRNSTLDMNVADSGTVTFAQDSTLGGLAGTRNLDMSGRTLAVGNNDQGTIYAGTLSNGGLTKVGSGTLALAGNSGYAGTTLVSAGSLEFSGTNANANVQVNGATGALRITGGSTAIATTSGNSYVTGGGLLEVTGGSFVVSGAGAWFSVGDNGAIPDGTGTVRITGGTFTNTNGLGITVGATGTGAVIVDGGVFTANDGANAGIRLGEFAGGSGSLTLQGGVLAVDRVQVGSGTGTIVFNGGTLAATGDVVDILPSNARLAATLASGGMIVGGARDFSISQPLGGVGGVTKTDANIVTLSGSSTYAGITSVTSGTLVAANASAFGNGAGSMVVQGGAIDLGGYHVVRTGTVSITGGTLRSGTITNHTVAYDAQAGTISAVLAGSAGLVKSGTGAVTLTSLQMFTGPTTVAAGTLDLDAGSGLASSLVTVAAGAFLDATGLGGLSVSGSQTLGGNGTVIGGFTIAGGATLAPGASPGTLTGTSGVITWGNAGNYNWQIHTVAGGVGSGTGWDFLDSSGPLVITATSGGFNINLWSLSAVSPDVNGTVPDFNPNFFYGFPIAEFDGGITGFTPSAFTVNVGAFNGTGGFTNTLNGSFSVALGDTVGGSANQIYLVYAAAPEPHGLALAGLGLLVAGWRLVRRRPLEPAT